ncbi:glycosyl hydrolase [Lutibacter sp. B1]|uniref:glycosyl hydrolase n=1 Tax=Lutibacter sp. B1 TaxID=2725996 RepID=UPI0014568F7E|nr:glycosyl hydrolase [Lutibacter sp. B1]NLP57741.1 beta-mannosidase [Lutibacter sp. B1]
MKKIIVFSLAIALAIFTNSCSSGGNSPEPTPTPEKATVTINPTKDKALEPGVNGEFTITLSKAISTATTVYYKVEGTATNGVDYQEIETNISVPAKSTSVKIPVVVIDDEETEGTETVIITLSDTDNGNVTISTLNKAIVSIEEEEETVPYVPSIEPGATRSYMVNSNATDETVALFYNLKILSETNNVIIGQQDAFNAFYNDNTGDSDIKKTTGSDPGLLGSDFMFITDDNNDGTSSNWFYQQEEIITGDAIEAYDKGMVNTFCWHFREPYSGDEFYASNINSDDLNKAFQSILPGGENHEYYKQKLQKIAEVTKGMVGSDGKQVPIVFRPFHEFDGSWFWWGANYCTPSEYIELWQFTVEYLRDDLQVDNMLFAFSPDNNFTTASQYLERYPGDEYVDILGMDNYGDFANQGQSGANTANSKLQVLTNLAKEKVKIAALTETGYRVDSNHSPISNLYSTYFYSALTNNNVEVAFMMFWNNNSDGYYTPVPGESDANDFVSFYNKEETLFQNNLPDLYTLPN